MAYLAYKYIKRKREERKAATAEPGQYSPDIPAAQRSSHKPKVEPLAGEHENGQRVDAVSNAEGHSELHEGHSTQVVDPAEAAKIKAETHRRRAYRWKMVLGLILPNFLASVDTTIVAPAVPIISSHFNHLSGSFNWIVAAYTLTLTTFVPLSGQIADIYGRHTALQFHIFCMMIGSVFATAANSWGLLLFGRAVQGVGAAGINNLTRVVLSDNVSLADNSKNNTVFSLIGGISYAIGPVIGGYLAQASWRYVFVISIPIAFLSHVLIFFLMRKDLVKGRVSRHDTNRTGYFVGLLTFDWPGMVFFIFGVGLIILAVMWGGTENPWSSAACIAPLVIGGLCSITFWFYEYLLEPGRLFARTFPRQVAMIPWLLFKKHDTFLLMVVNFATGAALYSAFYFISIYWEVAEGYSASDAGVQLLYYTPGIGVGVYSAMFFCNVWPRQTFYPLFTGTLIEAAGLGLLTWAVSSRRKALVNGMMAVSGAGTGLRFMPVTLHAAGIWPQRLAAVMSVLGFMLPFGGTIAISMMGSVFTNKFNEALKHIAPQISNTQFSSGAPTNLAALNDLPQPAKDLVQHAAARAVMWAFISIMPFMALSVLASAKLGNVWIGKPGEKGKAEIKGKVYYGKFLNGLLTGRMEAGKQDLDQAAPTTNEREVLSDEEKGEERGIIRP